MTHLASETTSPQHGTEMFLNTVKSILLLFCFWKVFEKESHLDDDDFLEINDSDTKMFEDDEVPPGCEEMLCSPKLKSKISSTLETYSNPATIGILAYNNCSLHIPVTEFFNRPWVRSRSCCRCWWKLCCPLVPHMHFVWEEMQFRRKYLETLGIASSSFPVFGKCSHCFICFFEMDILFLFIDNIFYF